MIDLPRAFSPELCLLYAPEILQASCNLFEENGLKGNDATVDVVVSEGVFPPTPMGSEATHYSFLAIRGSEGRSALVERRLASGFLIASAGIRETDGNLVWSANKPARELSEGLFARVTLSRELPPRLELSTSGVDFKIIEGPSAKRNIDNVLEAVTNRVHAGYVSAVPLAASKGVERTFDNLLYKF
jgi:hypothetical protein